MILFITGGARSGKSTAAVEAARHCGRAVVFVATATAGDDEMVERIARHQNERPDEWTTVEAPCALAIVYPKSERNVITPSSSAMPIRPVYGERRSRTHVFFSSIPAPSAARIVSSSTVP